jgi:hypothetical protein
VLQAGVDRLGQLSLCETEVKRDRTSVEKESFLPEQRSKDAPDESDLKQDDSLLEFTSMDANVSDADVEQAIRNMQRISTLGPNVDSRVVEFLFKLQLITAFGLVDRDLGFDISDKLMNHLSKHELTCLDAVDPIEQGTAHTDLVFSSNYTLQSHDHLMTTGAKAKFKEITQIYKVVKKTLKDLQDYLAEEFVRGLWSQKAKLGARILAALSAVGAVMYIIKWRNEGMQNVWAFEAAGGPGMSSWDFVEFYYPNVWKLPQAGIRLALGAIDIFTPFNPWTAPSTSSGEAYFASMIGAIFGPSYRNMKKLATGALFASYMFYKFKQREEQWTYLNQSFQEFDLGDGAQYLDQVPLAKRASLRAALQPWRQMYNDATSKLALYANPGKTDWIQENDPNYLPILRRPPPKSELRLRLMELRAIREDIKEKFQLQ